MKVVITRRDMKKMISPSNKNGHCSKNSKPPPLHDDEASGWVAIDSDRRKYVGKKIAIFGDIPRTRPSTMGDY